MHRGIIMFQIFITKIKKQWSHQKIGKQIGFHPDLMSRITVRLSLPPVTQQRSLWLFPDPKYIWCLVLDPICLGNSLRVEQTSPVLKQKTWGTPQIQNRV
jgi:hypothetical protein